MIRTRPDLLKLDGDRDADARSARSAGWMIDEDYWWVRPQRPDDPLTRQHQGFGFVSQRHVFCATAEACISYDAFISEGGAS